MAMQEDAPTFLSEKEFKDAKPLLISEVAILLEHKQKQADNTVFKEVFDSTLDYAQRFSRYKDKALIEEVRQILKKYALLDYEAVQIGDLCPENTEEARALIPSLHNQEDRVLQALLDDLSKLRKYT